MPKKAPEEPKPLSFATPNPWSALPREVHVGTGHGKKEGATTESPVDGQDQPKIYIIRDHTLEVLMHPDVLELHAVRVVHTPLLWLRTAAAQQRSATARKSQVAVAIALTVCE